MKDFEYELTLSENIDHFYKSYPMPRKYEEAVDFEIKRMLDLDIIERLKTTFINPIVCVIEKNGSVRLCLDARFLNDKLTNDYDVERQKMFHCTKMFF